MIAPKWSPPCTVVELARTAYQLRRWEGPGSYERAADRLDHLRIRLGASVSFDTSALTWVVIVPGVGNDEDEEVESPSITALCETLDAIVTRRTVHLEEWMRSALAGLAVRWAADYRVGYDKTNDECWAERLDGRGTRLTAPTPEALNKLMSDSIFTYYPPPAGGTGGGSGMSVPGQ